MQEPTLKLVNQKRVFALGDDAFIEDPTKDTLQSQFPATAQVALQQADYVAFNLWADINNRSLLPFRFVQLFCFETNGFEQIPTLGRYDVIGITECSHRFADFASDRVYEFHSKFFSLPIDKMGGFGICNNNNLG